MYTIKAKDGQKYISTNDLFEKMVAAGEEAHTRMQTERRKNNMLRELVYDYRAKLQNALDKMSRGAIKNLEISDVKEGLKGCLWFDFGHGRAYVRVTFKMDESWEISGEVEYSGIHSFEHKSAAVESVDQIIAFCERPISLLIIGHYVTDYSAKHSLELSLIDEQYIKKEN